MASFKEFVYAFEQFNVTLTNILGLIVVEGEGF